MLVSFAKANSTAYLMLCSPQAADHPSHERFGVPEHYEPLLPGVADHIDSGTLSPNDLCSFGVRVSSGGFEIFASEYSNHTFEILRLH